MLTVNGRCVRHTSSNIIKTDLTCWRFKSGIKIGKRRDISDFECGLVPYGLVWISEVVLRISHTTFSLLNVYWMVWKGEKKNLCSAILCYSQRFKCLVDARGEWLCRQEGTIQTIQIITCYNKGMKKSTWNLKGDRLQQKTTAGATPVS